MQVFKVGGMSCQHCVKAITTAVQKADPAATVTVSLEAGTVAVDSKTQSEAQLRGIIAEEGYTVQT